MKMTRRPNAMLMQAARNRARVGAGVGAGVRIELYPNSAGGAGGAGGAGASGAGADGATSASPWIPGLLPHTIRCSPLGRTSGLFIAKIQKVV